MTSLDQIVNTYEEYRVAPRIVCKDGFSLSVQASNGHHCEDANGSVEHYWRGTTPALPFSSVEVGYPSERPEPWHCTAWHDGWDRHEDHPVCDGWEKRSEDEDGGGVYSYVPVQVVRDLIERHGGESS